MKIKMPIALTASLLAVFGLCSRTLAAANKTALSVCVFCGASDGDNPRYKALAQKIGAGIAQRHWTLVYGGGGHGLMGEVARSAHAQGTDIVEVMPAFMRLWPRDADVPDEKITVTTLGERKALLQGRSNAFIVLPGGLGTIDELCDTIELKQVGQLDKPVIIVNESGYYDGLLGFLRHSIESRFSPGSVLTHFKVAGSAEEAFALIEEDAIKPVSK